MTHFTRIGRFTVVVMAVMALAYCSDSGSPTAPSIPGPSGSSSGATVQGTVNANRQSAGLAVPPVTAATTLPWQWLGQR